MRAQDLQSQVDLPESEHEYEDTLDVIKLPLPIPGQRNYPAPQFLFIRPDEYALFQCFGQHHLCILTGNGAFLNLGFSGSSFYFVII